MSMPFIERRRSRHLPAHLSLRLWITAIAQLIPKKDFASQPSLRRLPLRPALPPTRMVNVGLVASVRVGAP